MFEKKKKEPGKENTLRASALSKNPDFSIGKISKIRIFGPNADVGDAEGLG